MTGTGERMDSKEPKTAIDEGAVQLVPRWERAAVLALCVVGAARVFLFSAAFPFFNNVDESPHFDLVHKYSRGHVPKAPGRPVVRPARCRPGFAQPRDALPPWPPLPAPLRTVPAPRRP